jgi:hypothetical protein
VDAASLICAAIERRVLLKFQYKGYPRVVAPYCHGISTTGNEVLRAVQVRGFSGSGFKRTGKLWTVSDMVNTRITDEPFKPNDPQYNPNDTAMKEIHCQIAPP